MLERSGAEQVSRWLVDKRSEVYSRVATLIMDLEEGLEEDDGLRVRFLLRDLRRTLRGALAFLTDEVYQELERIELLIDLLPAEEGPVPPAARGQLGDRLQLLHVKLARALKLSTLQDLERIVSLPARLRQRMEEEGRERERQAREREVEEQCWQHESEARAQIGRKLYPKAIKSLKKAVRLDPDRAVFQNDLGVVHSLLGRNEEAIAHYRNAVSLNELHAEKRTEEWTTSYYNLGIALRKVAQGRLADGGVLGEDTLELLREARMAFDSYTRLKVSGPKVQDARSIAEQISRQLAQLEAAVAEEAAPGQ